MTPQVRQILHAPRPQAQLTVGAPDDAFEREADEVAERVMRMPDPVAAASAAAASAPPRVQRTCAHCAAELEGEATVQRMCSHCAAEAEGEGTVQRMCDDCEDELQAKEEPGATPAVPAGFASRFAALHGAGRQLPAAERAFFEPRFGQDFAAVQVHSGAAASELARSVQARAFTLGRSIVFAPGEYAPGTSAGRRLLAHELTHVVQQSGGSPESAAAADAEAPSRIQRVCADCAGGVEGDGVLRRRPAPAPAPAPAPGDAPPPPLTRREEIELSRTSPGRIAGVIDPLTLSLFNYAIDEDDPKPEHLTALNELGRLLGRGATGDVRMRVFGHADASGPERYNDKLSRRRADRARAILQPLVSHKVSLVALGELQPTVPNDTVEGRSRNRRVEIRLYNLRPPPPPPPRPPPRPPDDPEKPKPPKPPEPPVPPGVETDVCDLYPVLCGTIGWPWMLPLICVVVPELCACLVLPELCGCVAEPLVCLCVLAPELCTDGPPKPPKKPPKEPDKPRKSGLPKVVFIPDVREPTSPAGMNDRIAKGQPVSITAVVTDPPEPPGRILIDVDGAGPVTGEATLDGGTQLWITGTTRFEVRGTTMTLPSQPLSPWLQLGAWYASDLVGASNTFAVSAIMEDWSTRFLGSRRFPTGFDFDVHMLWASDSRRIRDLTACQWCEEVALESETGGMVGMGIGGVQDCDEEILFGDLMPGIDTHGTESRWLRRAGSQRLHQLWKVRDLRSNSGWVPSRSSGFKIDRIYERDPLNKSCWRLLVTKSGEAVTIGAMSTDAGSGSARKNFNRLNCDPPPKPPEPPTPPTPDDGGGDGGVIVARRVTPRPAPSSGSRIAGHFTYHSGLPREPTAGRVYGIDIVFGSQGGTYLARVPFRVGAYDPTDPSARIPISCAASGPVNVAPTRHPDLILSPGTRIVVPRSRLR